MYTTASPFARPLFHEAAELTDEDIQHLVETIRTRVLRLLRAHGLLTDEGQLSLDEVDEPGDLLPLFQAASIQGRVAQGPDAGAPLERLNRIAAGGSRFRPPPLCAELNGFSLHAALVPPPRTHQQTYHGVLAPSSSWRDDVVIANPASRRALSPSPEATAGAPTRPAHRYLWSELMRRVFGIDVLCCKHCRSRRRLVSLITERSVILRILAHLGLDTDPLPIQPARAPPQLELAF